MKIRGFRVEPEEVTPSSTRLGRRVRGGGDLPPDDRGEAYLAAYAVPADPIGRTTDARQALADRLVAANSPPGSRSTWCRGPGRSCTALPRNAHGKLDRAALRRPIGP